ncbi:MAG: hypothetical protein IKL08_01290, partial [Clostridia bacterium]|nr:hypothetical protein [Clostridia bacterium]
RHGAAMSIPVILNDLFIRVFWAIKRHYYHELDWKDCIPRIEHSRSLHQMVLAGNAGLCIVDGIDAYIRSGGNMLTFVLRLNLVAWGRLLVLIWKYLSISKAKMEYERNHIKSQAVIKALEKETLEFQNNVKEFLESQQLTIAKNMTIVIRSLSVNDFNATGDALNNITLLFGGEPQFKTLVEFDKFMSDPNTTLELC